MLYSESQFSDANILSLCPPLGDYVARVASERDLDAEVRNFRTIALTEPIPSSRYRRDRVTIKLARDGTVTSPRGFEPTEAEAAMIKAVYPSLNLPKSIRTTKAAAEDQRDALSSARLKCDKPPVAKEDWFVLLDNNRDDVAMCQLREEKRRKDGTIGKDYVPWTMWSDGRWRCMEPEDGLPMWKPPQARNVGAIMIHEGAKAARHADWLVNDSSPEEREARARHPWAVELASYEHFGWLGGAPNPNRTNWGELESYDLLEVTVATDNDFQGKQAIGPISRLLKFLRVPLWEIRFDDGFPEGFDLADPLPQKFWVRGRYRGSTLRDLQRSVTWATRVASVRETRRGQIITYGARVPFLKQWLVATKPPVFVHRDDPGRLLDAEEFDAHMLAFSDVKKTGDILRREPAINVAGVAYEPGRNAGIIAMDGKMFVNTWTPTRVGRRKGDVTPFLEFMSHLIPVERDRAHLLRWIATFVARPDIRMPHGILLISEQQGVGKGTLMEKVLAPLAGWHNTSVPNEKMIIDSSFNSWLVRKRLVLVHEIYAGNTKKAYNVIKSYVTDESIRVNEKNLPEYNIRNWTHYVLSSNSFHALNLVKNDRRWAVPTVTEAKRDRSYWLTLNAWLVDGGLEIIHDWAHAYVDEHSTVGAADEAPASAAKDRLIASSRSEGMQLVYDLGEAAVRIEEPVVLTDRAVRAWLVPKRELRSLSDPKLESLGTIRTQLRNAGMMEVLDHKTDGLRFTAFANQTAIEKVNAAINSTPSAAFPVDSWTWNDLKPHLMVPAKVIARDEGNPDPDPGRGSGTDRDPGAGVESGW